MIHAKVEEVKSIIGNRGIAYGFWSDAGGTYLSAASVTHNETFFIMPMMNLTSHQLASLLKETFKAHYKYDLAHEYTAE